MTAEIFPKEGERQLQGLRKEIDNLLSKLEPLGIRERLPSVKMDCTLEDIETLVEKIGDLVGKVEDEAVAVQV